MALTSSLAHPHIPPVNILQSEYKITGTKTFPVIHIRTSTEHQTEMPRRDHVAVEFEDKMRVLPVRWQRWNAPATFMHTAKSSKERHAAKSHA